MLNINILYRYGKISNKRTRGMEEQRPKKTTCLGRCKTSGQNLAG